MPDIFSVFYYTPQTTSMKILPAIIIAVLIKKYYPNNKTVSNTAFYGFLGIVAVVTLLTNPGFFVSKAILLIVFGYITKHYYSKWNHPSKIWFLLGGCIFLLITATLVKYGYIGSTDITDIPRELPGMLGGDHASIIIKPAEKIIEYVKDLFGSERQDAHAKEFPNAHEGRKLPEKAADAVKDIIPQGFDSKNVEILNKVVDTTIDNPLTRAASTRAGIIDDKLSGTLYFQKQVLEVEERLHESTTQTPLSKSQDW